MNPVKNMLNTIAYMSSAFRRADWRLAGFKKLSGVFVSWGVNVNGEYYSAMYVPDGPRDNPISEQIDYEKKLIAEGKLFPIMLFGSDNTSYVIRFETREQAQEFVSSHDPYNCNSGSPTALYYNS